MIEIRILKDGSIKTFVQDQHDEFLTPRYLFRRFIEYFGLRATDYQILKDMPELSV